jgi:hypothetical protein
MSISIKHEILPKRADDDWKPRPALREAMQMIATIAVDDETALIGDRSITFQNGVERTTISAEPVNADTVDGLRIAEIVTIRTPMTGYKLFDENGYAVVNLFATTGAIVREADGQDAIVSRLPLFEGDDVALADLYTPLIANASRLHMVGMQCGFYRIQGRGDEYTAADVALPGFDEPSRWEAYEFQRAEERLRMHGAYANAGPAGLTVEFPWEQGATSAMLGDCTSLLRIRADFPHPSAGNGLFFCLDLPVPFEDKDVQSSAAALNRAEAEGIDTPPFFGAWCSLPGSRALSFAGFWPNVMYQPGTATNIAFWSWARSRYARQTIGNLH